MKAKFIAIAERLRDYLRMRGIADALGKSHPYLVQVTQAAEVYKLVTRVTSFKATGIHRNLAEIHAAPQWLWIALVQQMVESGWIMRFVANAVDSGGDGEGWECCKTRGNAKRRCR